LRVFFFFFFLKLNMHIMKFHDIKVPYTVHVVMGESLWVEIGKKGNCREY